MELYSNITTWKRLLETLEKTEDRIQRKDLEELALVFDHVPTQVAIRQRKDHEACVVKSEKLLHDLFDRIDLSDKQLLCAFLRTVQSYGYFRIAQITYCLESRTDDAVTAVSQLPTIEKTKWHDMTPLLPEAGTIGWKAILNHGLVKEERQLMQVSLQLIKQKLHCYSILSTNEQFADCSRVIQRNGERVAEKLFELIRDVAYDDESIVGIDAFSFDLLMPFTSTEQQAAILDAIIQDLFKPFLLQKPAEARGIERLYNLIQSRILDNHKLQEIFVPKLLEHMKCNIIRRKRRHSVEAVQQDGITLESILEQINAEEKLSVLLPSLNDVEVSHKSLQISYISYWVQVVRQIIPMRALTAQNSMLIMNTCSSILIVGCTIFPQDLTCNLSFLIADVIENTAQSNLVKLFRSCNPLLLIELTKVFTEKTNLLSTFNTPIQKLYKIYLSRYLRFCIARQKEPEAGKLEELVNFVCDKEINKDASHLLQYVCVHELSSCLEGSKKRANNKMVELFIDCSRLCSRRLYKFIKRNLKSQAADSKTSDIDDEAMNESNTSTSTYHNEGKQGVVLDALISILRTAIERKDQETLDMYGDLLIKLYNLMIVRTENLIETVKLGSKNSTGSLDSYLSKLLSLYVEHRDVVHAYLNYDLVEKMSTLLVAEESSGMTNGFSSSNQSPAKRNKKAIYHEVKTKLENLAERANQFADVYYTIINKQYNSVVEQSLSSTSDIQKEKSCCANYLDQMQTLGEISTKILKSCDESVYKLVLNRIVTEFENCDPLDHPKFLYLALMFESLIQRHTATSKDCATFQALKDVLPRITCTLIMVSKSVELGPAVLAFTRSGGHKSSKAIQCCTYSTCIKLYSQIFSKFPPAIADQYLTDAMQICISANLMHYSKYTKRLHKFFIQLASAIAGLLRSICIGRKEEEILKSSIPIFLSVFSLLIRCLVLASDKFNLEEMPTKHMNGHSNHNHDDDQMDVDNPVGVDGQDQRNVPNKPFEVQLELLAIDISKILNNLSFLRVKLIQYAPYLISTYVKDVQEASCPDFVRLHLNEGIFRIFNLIDAHQKERQDEIIEEGIQRKTIAGRASGSLFEMIHARLDQASREIFRDLHDNYNRFHRYVGKC